MQNFFSSSLPHSCLHYYKVDYSVPARQEDKNVEISVYTHITILLTCGSLTDEMLPLPCHTYVRAVKHMPVARWLAHFTVKPFVQLLNRLIGLQSSFVYGATKAE